MNLVGNYEFNDKEFLHKRFMVELSARDIQLIHAGLLWLDDLVTPGLSDTSEKLTAIEDLWTLFDKLREGADIPLLGL